ncbi:8934_t:CDS:2 [Racocetra persica]|uniref:8934_t:CDS:1 n=1 Tax=Racocetra persica TaxID=160502 RepID=A0ACA9KX72_9GLOM|nr:8934_t:CDS:2 [Racocetra persica]
MFASFISKILTFFTIIICLTALVTLAGSVPDCPLTQNVNEKEKKFIIQFNSAIAAKNFYTILDLCNKKIKTYVDFSNIKSDLKDKSIILDISFWEFHACIGYFKPSDVANLLTLDGILRIENDIMLKTTAKIPSCLSTRQKPNPNLDRIDQEHFPLDGEYTCIKVDHEEFEGRATFGTTTCKDCPDTDDHGLSLGGPASQSFNDAVESIIKMGIHVVVAAGNNNDDACNYSLASASGVITVGATEDTSDSVASFSNIGPCVGIFAPGRNILSAGINSETAIYSGTSQATPHGAIALIIENTGNVSPSRMKQIIDDLATKNIVTGIDSSTPNNFLRVPFTCSK